MTLPVTISYGGRHVTSRLPWGVHLGGVQVERCATLAAAKAFARRRYAVETDRAAPGYYVERIGDEREDGS